jgi:hypothetical protein
LALRADWGGVIGVRPLGVVIVSGAFGRSHPDAVYERNCGERVCALFADGGLILAG